MSAKGHSGTILRFVARRSARTPCHETIGHALAAVSRVGLDVGDHDGVAPFVVIGDRHDVAVDDKFVPLALGDVSDRVLHIGSVARKGARSAT